MRGRWTHSFASIAARRKAGTLPKSSELVAAASAGVAVSAVDYIESGAAFRREDVGPASSGETARKDAEIEELRNAKRMLEIKIAGLESETEELKAQVRGLEDRGLQVFRSQRSSTSSSTGCRPVSPKSIC